MILIMIQLRATNQVSVGDFVFVFGMVFQFQENLWHLMQEFHKLSDKMGDLKSSLTIQTADINEFPEAEKEIVSPITYSTRTDFSVSDGYQPELHSPTASILKIFILAIVTVNKSLITLIYKLILVKK